MIRKGDWKLLQNHPFEPMQLLNLKNDPAEENPKPPHGKVAQDLIRYLDEALQKAGNMPWQKPERICSLPARSGTGFYARKDDRNVRDFSSSFHSPLAQASLA